MKNHPVLTVLFIILLLGLVFVPEFTGNSVLGAGDISGIEETQSEKSQYDPSGNEVLDEAGNQYNYLVSVNNTFSRVNANEANQILQNVTYQTESVASSPLVGGFVPNGAPPPREYLSQIWKTGILGTGIGASGLSAIDIDDDGVVEILAGGGYGFGSNRFWSVLSYAEATGGYQQEWMSREYSQTIRRLLFAEVNGNAAIYVALSDGTIEIYDATTRQLVNSFSSPFNSLADMVIVDVDNDNVQEIVTSSTSGIVVHHATTFAIEWQTTTYRSNDIEVANVDSDPAPEIVTTNQVIDGISHDLEWNSTSSFGAIIQLADIDNDDMAEIVAAEAWYRINAFDADIQAPKWDIAVDLDIDALIVTDFDNDQVPEIVYGDGQWGSVYAIDSSTLAEEWRIRNPEHGVTGIAFADVDNDDVLEVLWGAGWSSSGSDHLFIGDTTTRTIEWRSQDNGGPLSALDVGDVDNDGTDEIVMASFESDSGYDDGMIFIYDAETFELEWQSAPILNGRAWTGINGLLLADVDEDEVLEILIATAYLYDGRILAYDGITHELDWQTVNHGGTFFSALAAADIDNDGDVEVIGGQDREHTGAPGVYVRVFDGSTGVEEWRTTNLSYWGGVYDIDTGNVDADENPEIIFSVTDGNAYVYDGVTQTQEWQSSYTSTRAVAIMDVDQDEENEFLVGRSNGQLYAYDGQTEALEWSQSISSASVNSLRLVDMNYDHNPELVLTDNDFLYVYDPLTRDRLWRSDDLGASVGRGGHLAVADINGDTRFEVVVGTNTAVHVFAYSLLPFSSLLNVTPSIMYPEGILNYVIEVVNHADVNLPVTMTDTIPSDTTYVPGSLEASSGLEDLNNNIITWDVELAPRETVSLTFDVTIDPEMGDGIEISNTAVYSAAHFLDSKTVTTIVDAQPPTSTIDDPLTGQMISGTTYSVQGSAADATSGVDFVEIRINDGPWQPVIGTTNWSYSWTLPITDDLFIIETRATDKVGHVESLPPQMPVIVDNLHPEIVSITPAHGDTTVWPDTPIEIEFSEPVALDTFEFICQPGIDEWMITQSDDQKTVILNHSPFDFGQLYSCKVDYIEDKANHSLIASQISNPWAFRVASNVYHTFLPLVVNPPNQFDTVVVNNSPIPSRSVINEGEVFYSTTAVIDATLPTNGTFYLSATANAPNAAAVDDKVAILLHGSELFTHTYGQSGSGVTPALVEIPRSVMMQIAGKTVIIEFRDVYGDTVSATALYLIWTP